MHLITDTTRLFSKNAHFDSKNVHCVLVRYVVELVTETTLDNSEIESRMVFRKLIK